LSSREAEAPQRYYEEGREYSAKEDVNLGGSGVLDRGCANFAMTEFYEVQLREAECLSVRRVMSSSCSQPSPTKE
jgi:hypothetical protein